MIDTISRSRCAIAFLISTISLASAIAEPLKVAELSKDRGVLYSADVFPVLKKNCFACHNDSRDEGGVNLESVEKMMASDVEEVLVVGKADASRLFAVASHIDEPVMPPEDNEVGASNLNPEELALLKRWIEAGARVDKANPGHVEYQWQPLPPHLRTVYASAMTPDGRLAVASFGNQIRVFGGSSPTPLASLELPPVDGKPTPPHLDFVQDLAMTDDGRTIVSSGFRNVKIWKMRRMQTAAVPEIRNEGVLSTVLDRTGTHVANLSNRGEVKVGMVGKDRWQWLKGFDVPDSFKSANPPKVFAAIDGTGESVAVAWGTDLRIVRKNENGASLFVSPKPVTSITWDRNGRLVTGDESGDVHFWISDGDGLKPVTVKLGDKPVTELLVPSNGAALLAVDSAGATGIWHAAETTLKEMKQLPGPAKLVAASATGGSVWATLNDGKFGRFDFATSKLIEKPRFDPNAVDAYARANWNMLVGERLVSATEKELKTAQDNEASEKKNIENATKDIEAKTKARDEKRKPAEDAKKAGDAANAKLLQEQKKEAETNQLRKQLAEKIKQIDTNAAVLAKEKKTVVTEVTAVALKIAAKEKEIAVAKAELQAKLDAMNVAMTELTKTKAALEQKATAAQKKLDEDKAAKVAAEKEFKALSTEKALADAAKAAADAAAKAKAEADAKANELAKAESALELSVNSKQRGEARLKQSAEEVANRQRIVEESKTQQEERKKQDRAAKAAQDKSLGADKVLAAIGGGKTLVTASSASGQWNLWSIEGDWISNLPEIPAGGELIASGDRCLLIRGADGKVNAYRPPASLWSHDLTIGSPIGDSPFADRVLTVAIDPEEKLLATGGGEPSRNGELQIWNLSDGSLVRNFKTPHTDTVLAIRFSPDGKTMASSSADRMVKLWDVATGELKKTLEGHTHHVNSIAWNVNNRQLSSVSADSTVKIWDVSTGQATRTITGLKSELTRLVYVGRDDRVGFVSGDNYFRVYRTDNGGRETNAKVAEAYLYALAANRDGTKFLLGGADGKVKIVDKAGKDLLKYE